MKLQGSKTAAALVALSAFVPNIFMADGAFAQQTANDTMNITAKVVNPLDITPSITFNLNFQSFAIKGAGSYVVLPGGTTSISSGVTLGGATPATAILKVPQNVLFTLSVPTYKTTAIIMKNGTGGVSSKKMTVKSLLFAGVSGLSNMTGTLKNGTAQIKSIKVTNPADTGKLAMGARIIFGPNQVEGTYTGTFVVRITL